MRFVFKGLAVTLAMMAASQAFADLASNHIIRNTVDVEYNDFGGTEVAGPGDLSASVDITVNLVPTAPTVAFDSGPSGATDAVAVGETVNLFYTVTSNANGPDTYEETTQLSIANIVSINNPTNPTLGATTVGDDNGGTLSLTTDGDSANAVTVPVPADDASGDGVNGFDGNGTETAVFATGSGPAVCTVSAVDDSNGGDANALSSIDVYACDNAYSLAVGDQIGERVSIELQVTGDDQGTTELTVSFSSTTDTNESDTDVNAPQTITVLEEDLRVFKFVRNITTTSNNPDGGSNDGSGCSGTGGLGSATLACADVNGTHYYANSVTTQPGDTLEYLIVLINAGAKATSIAATDGIALFTSFQSGTINLIPLADTAEADATGDCLTTGHECVIGGTFVGAASDGTTDDYGALNTGADPAQVEVSAGHDGNTGSEAPVSPETAGGELEQDQVSVFKFQVAVDGP